jgi:hypothetical protein
LLHVTTRVTPRSVMSSLLTVRSRVPGLRRDGDILTPSLGYPSFSSLYTTCIFSRTKRKARSRSRCACSLCPENRGLGWHVRCAFVSLANCKVLKICGPAWRKRMITTMFGCASSSKGCRQDGMFFWVTALGLAAIEFGCGI